MVHVLAARDSARSRLGWQRRLHGHRIERSWVAELVIGLFAAASVAMPFGAVVIWRSASNYPREAWWQTLLAMGAKLCAGFWGLLGILCILGFFYLAYGAISAVLAPD